ncbi:MAG: 3-oxoacyl-[acyl-carrier-protein] synthase III C-terminal domain-containing protein [Rubrivivax sp.]
MTHHPPVPPAFINAIGTAVPAHDVHAAFVAYARTLLASSREQTLFDRMSERSGIAHRHSVLRPGRLDAGEVDAGGFYRPGDFPTTAARMALYREHALPLALRAVHALQARESAHPADSVDAPVQPTSSLPANESFRSGPAPDALADITHLVVASCTGLVAPGLDVQLIDALGLDARVQRTVIGFMGCAAAVPALRAAAHTVRAEPGAKVLVVNVELCSLHLRESRSLEELLSFLLFGDAASAAIVSARPEGAELLDFRSILLPQSRPLITWDIGDHGFEMQLSGLVPGRIATALTADRQRAGDGGLLRGATPSDIALWAVHAGGRTVLDAVEKGLALPPDALATSRAVLADVGNVSSVTVMMVLQRMLSDPQSHGLGLAMAFGPGLSAETLRFRISREAKG